MGRVSLCYTPATSVRLLSIGPVVAGYTYRIKVTITNFLGLAHTGFHSFQVVDKLIPRVEGFPSLQNAVFSRFESIALELHARFEDSCFDYYTASDKRMQHYPYQWGASSGRQVDTVSI